MTLPANEIRCHDWRCAQRFDCRRWTEKEIGPAGIPVSRVDSLRTTGGGECQNRIPLVHGAIRR